MNEEPKPLKPSDSDVYSETFESKMDPYFTSSVKDDGYEKFRRTDRTTERSMLATTRPIAKPI